MAFTWNLRVRFVDTDASGRIHYTAMLRFFEAAEFEFLRHQGSSYNNFAECSFPRVHVECDYKSVVQHEDLLSVAVSIAHLGNSSFTYAFHASCEGREVAQGKITVVCLNRSSMKPQPLPAGLRDALLKP